MNANAATEGLLLTIEATKNLIAIARNEIRRFDQDRLLDVADELKQLAACAQHLAAELLDHHEQQNKK